MISEVKRRTGWKTIDQIKITGDQKGRDCTALSNDHSYHFMIRFDPLGAIDTFVERDP